MLNYHLTKSGLSLSVGRTESAVGHCSKTDTSAEFWVVPEEAVEEYLKTERYSGTDEEITEAIENYIETHTLDEIEETEGEPITEGREGRNI